MADEMNINPSQQPEENSQQGVPDKVQETIQALKNQGVDVNILFNMMGGIAENVMKKAEVTLSSLIETKVQVMAKGLSQQIQDQQRGMESQMSQVVALLQGGSGGHDTMQPNNAMMPMGGELPAGPGLMPQGGGGGNNPLMILNQLSPVLKMLGLGGGGGNSEGSGMEQMIKAAEGYGKFVSAIMAPITDMQTSMRQSLLQEMQTYSRTGGSLPWDHEEEPATAPTARLTNSRQQRPAQRQIVLNQEIDDSPSDYSKEAAELVKRFKFA